ncbi:hypothetical protein ACH5A7_20965 [Streptomyces sp. NPDC018955]|uniref:hypothetical protein n=1 Tax=Streptomyces sp. NPDC018955 TaxID=3365055 RepID=UPI00379BDBBE
MTDRHTVDTITSDALDALYEQLEAAEDSETQRQLATAREALASATTRAARAEAAIARARQLLAGRWGKVDPDLVRAALDNEQPAPAPTATQATDDAEHVCKLGSSVYYCPTSGTIESDCHGGFDTCCDRPDLHQPKEQPMPKPACTARIEGPHVLGGGPVHCTREAGHPGNHTGPQTSDGKTLWTDGNAGATPHQEQPGA